MLLLRHSINYIINVRSVPCLIPRNVLAMYYLNECLHFVTSEHIFVYINIVNIAMLSCIICIKTVIRNKTCEITDAFYSYFLDKLLIVRLKFSMK